MSIKKSDITALILAGGQGRRLGGQDKGLVEYRGEILIQNVLSKIAPQVHEVLINANRNHEIYNALGYTVITDELSDFQGPLAGFASAMKASDTPFIVTTPCDGPNLSHDFVSRLLAKANDSETIVVAHDGERLQPVHALIPCSLLSSLELFLESGDRKIDRWYAQNTMVTVDFSDMPNMFFNINTEEQRQTGHTND